MVLSVYVVGKDGVVLDDFTYLLIKVTSEWVGGVILMYKSADRRACGRRPREAVRSRSPAGHSVLRDIPR